ncbi:Protein kinase domain-containing protein [Balamuthia mandrillaris]
MDPHDLNEAVRKTDVDAPTPMNFSPSPSFDDLLFRDEYSGERPASPVVSVYNNIEVCSPNGQTKFNQTVVLEEKLGSGCFSDVYKATWNGQLVAVKVLKQCANQQKTFERELAALRRTLGWSSTIQLLGFRSAPCFWIITNFMNQGTLASRIEQQRATGKPFTTDQLLSVAVPLATTLHRLHSLSPPLLHRDLTPDNILFHDDQLCLGDFGVAVSLYHNPSAQPEGALEACLSPNGHPDYRAPEVLSGSYGLPAEVYSFASVLHAMVSAGSASTADVEALACPSWVKRLIGLCWAEPKARPTFADILAFLDQVKRAC